MPGGQPPGGGGTWAPLELTDALPSIERTINRSQSPLSWTEARFPYSPREFGIQVPTFPRPQGQKFCCKVSIKCPYSPTSAQGHSPPPLGEADDKCINGRLPIISWGGSDGAGEKKTRKTVARGHRIWEATKLFGAFVADLSGIEWVGLVKSRHYVQEIKRRTHCIWKWKLCRRRGGNCLHDSVLKCHLAIL